MTGNISYLSDYEPFDGGYVSFGQGGCKITGKGTIKTGKLEFKNVYFVKDLKYNLFSVSQICDNKNSVLFTNLKCIVLGKDIKDLTCIVAKASTDECMLWHKRLGHLNFNTMNKLVRHNLVRGLPTKCFENDHTCTACQKGKQHKASYNLGKFEEKRDEGYFIGYSMSSKAFRVFKKRIRRVEENLHVEFLENKAIEKGSDPNWLFDIYSLTKSMNYVPVDAGTISTNLSGTKDAASQEVKKDVSSLRYIALPNWAHDALLEFPSSKLQDHCSTKVPEDSGNPNPNASTSTPPANQMETLTVETPIPTISSPVPTAYSTNSQEPSSDVRLISKRVANQEETPSLENILSQSNQFEDILGVTLNSNESNGVEADISNMETTITASLTPTLRIHKDHPKNLQILPWTRRILRERTANTSPRAWSKDRFGKHKVKVEELRKEAMRWELEAEKWALNENERCSWMEARKQWEDKEREYALQDQRWVEAMQEELLYFKIQNVWTLVDCPKGEEGINYDEVFALFARIEAIRLFLAYASFMGFTVYQMDVKSAFLYGTINEEVEIPVLSWIETTDEVTKILATVDGILRTVTESSIRRNLKLNAEEGLKAQPSSHTHISSPTLPTVTTIHTVTPSEITPLRQYTRRARITQSLALPPMANKHASPMRDVNQGEACPTDSGFIADQDKANIAKTSTLLHESRLRVTSLAADEGSLQLRF
nr:putative ribonuclease H-like domain-containing protein [Tanacetum cinerariifolium]